MKESKTMNTLNPGRHRMHGTTKHKITSHFGH